MPSARADGHLPGPAAGRDRLKNGQFSRESLAPQGVTFPAVSVLLAHWVPPEERSRLGSFVFAGERHWSQDILHSLSLI